MTEPLAPPRPLRVLCVLRVWVPALVLFAAATVLLNWRTVRDLNTQRPAPEPSTLRYAGVMTANDTLAFSFHLTTSTEAVKRGTVYFPLSDFDCPITFLVPGGLLQWATGWPPIRVINVFTLVAVFLNGVAAFGLMRSGGAAGPVAAIAAVGYMAPNFVLYSQHMGHMNYVQVQWIAFTFWGLLATVRAGAGWWPAVGLGLAMGLQLLSSPSFALYLAYVALPLFAVTHWCVAPRPRPQLLGLALRGTVAVAVALAVAGAYLFPRMGAMPGRFDVPGPSFTWNHLGELFDPAHPTLFVGVGLFALGVLAGRWCCSNRSPAVAAALVTMCVATLCMLPAISGTPYWALREYAPLFDRMRVPTRFIPIVILMLLAPISWYLTASAERRTWATWGYAALLFLALLCNWLLSSWVCGYVIEQPPAKFNIVLPLAPPGPR